MTPRTARLMPRVVITHDFMETYGGAERVTQELARAFPSAPVYAFLGRPEVAERMGIADRFHALLPGREALLRGYRPLAPVLAAYADRAVLPEADVLLSSSYAFAHRLRTRNRAPQLCYLHSPLRFAWSMTDSYRGTWAPGRARGAAFEMLARRMRAGDRRAAHRVARFATQSPYVADQVRRFYAREAAVIGAPVDCARFRPDGREPDDFFLFCGRLIEPYKRVGLVLDAFARLPGQRLVVAGDGPALEELRRRATPNVEFVGHAGDERLVGLMQRCRAAVFPSTDDFGLVPVEVMACGRPVIAYAGGGAVHTVRDGVTGTLFDRLDPGALAATIEAFDPGAFDPEAIRAHACGWDSERFAERVVALVEETAARVAA